MKNYYLKLYKILKKNSSVTKICYIWYVQECFNRGPTLFLIVLGALKILLCWYMCICWNTQVLSSNVVTNLTLRKIGIYVHHCIIVYFDDLHSIRLVIIIIYLFIFIFIYQEFANDLHNWNMLFKDIGPFETKRNGGLIFHWKTYIYIC